MKKKNGTSGLSERTSDIILVAITGIVMLIVAYPLYYVLVASFSNPYDVYAGKTFLLPSDFSFKGYKAVFADPNILVGYKNSILYTVIGTVFSVTMLYITAYPLSQKDLPGRKFFSLFFLITMYFGGGLIPTYLVVKQTGLINNIWALFLPGGVAVGNMIIVRNYFQNSIPRELIEAAEIDGCGKIRLFSTIVVPLIVPSMATSAIFSFYWKWDDFMGSLLYLNSPKNYTVSIALKLFCDPTAVSDYGAMFAMCVVSLLPVIVLFLFTQRYIVEGIAMSGLKA